MDSSVTNVCRARKRGAFFAGWTPALAIAPLLACGSSSPSGRERASSAARLAPAPESACSATTAASRACGDPCAEGVVIEADVTTNTVWDCPVYTLPQPIFVRSDAPEPTRLVIAPGTVVKGRAGNLEEGRLPGALIVTRSGHLDARGTRSAPIVFTSARALGQRARGDWGGVVLLGRAPINVPADYEGSGNRAGEMFIEGLPRSEETSYGHPVAADAGAAEGDGGAPLGNTALPRDAGLLGAADDAGSVALVDPRDPDPDHDCGTLRFVRIEFAGFEVGDTNELNGLTVGACGRRSVLDYVQVHLGADDGIEFFGGTADLRHAVITGANDDSLDWDQGWTGRVQFLAIRQFDDAEGSGASDSGFEGDGYADPEAAQGEVSAPVMYNVTVLSSARSSRGIRLREGSRLALRNAILAAEPGGPLDGLIDIGDPATADQLTSGQTRINNSILEGAWPLRAQSDSSGKSYLAEDYFSVGAGSAGNTLLAASELSSLLPSAFTSNGAGWVPSRGSHASRDWVVPEPTVDSFFDAEATYRGAFDPSGEDWTSGWTSYPMR
jgi:hypothetical protein